MKKFLSILLVCLMVLSLGAAVAEGDKPTISVAIFDRGAVPADKGSYEDNWATQWINENAPVNVEFVPVPRWETYSTYSLWLASDTPTDIFMEFQPDYVQEWSAEGVLYELGDLIDEYAPNYRALTPQVVQDWGKYNGGEYAMVDARAETAVINHMCYIRADWLENLGLEMPTTLDELKEVIRAFTEDDPDGNGENDTWGWSFALQGTTLIQNMFGFHGGSWVVEDGKFISAHVSERALEAYKFMEEIYDNGWCDIEYLSDTNGTNAYAEFSSGKLGIICCGLGYLSSTIWDPLMANEPDAKVAPLPSVTDYGYYQERECSLLNMIPATSKNAAGAVQYLDWMLSEGWQTVKFGEPGVDFEYQGDLIVRLTNDDEYAAKFSYTQEYAVLSTYKDTIETYRQTYEAYDDSNLKKPAYLIQADAMDLTKDIKFYRATPITNLGIRSYNELMPDMDTIAGEYWAKALNSTEYTADQALADIIDEWSGMGYDEVEADYNAACAELGYAAE